jgi:hypothetical protein
MDGETLARRSLAIDSLYCLTVGTTGYLARGRLGILVQATPAVVGSAGLATVGWSALVHRLSKRDGWRSVTLLVAVANATASAVLLAAAVKHTKPAGRVVLAATSVDVGAFALSQAVALRG